MRARDPLTPSVAVARDPHRLLAQTRARWGGRSDLWIFGYASLIWRPEFQAVESHLATVHGYHRALRMRSRINRGTPERPGLVFALMRGGSCRGVVYRVVRRDANHVLEQLWAREMPTGVYDPRWIRCRTAHGVVAALAFTLSHRSPSFTGTIEDAEMINILRHARGRYGTTLEYLIETARGLGRHGIRDRHIERLIELARLHALVS